MPRNPIGEMNAQLERAAQAAGLDLRRLPTDDPEVMAAISVASPVEIPFLEAQAAGWVGEVSPRDLGELAVAMALYRPAPVEHGVACEFLERRRGRPVAPLHPLIDGLLGESMGLPIFYDQLDVCLSLLAGLSNDQAASLRRQLMRGGAQGEGGRQQLLSASQRRGVSSQGLEAVSHAMLRFARTAYPRAQAAGMALFVYRMTWLQLHHPDVVWGLDRG